MRDARITSRFWRAAVCSGVLAASLGCDVPDANLVFHQLAEAQHATAELQLAFAKASDAANRAVMAADDAQAARAAAEARTGLAAVAEQAGALGTRLTAARFAEEGQLLGDFTARFASYRDLEEQILALAVEHTNTKARQLAFGEGQQAVDAMRASLDRLEAGRTADQWHVRALALDLLANVEEIQVLQAPHIAEADDGVMTAIEQKMQAAGRRAGSALAALRPLVARAASGHLDAAARTFDQFQALNAQVLSLSRKNTNVRSIAMALEQKQAAIAACEDRLRALGAALAKRRPATRGTS